MSARTRSVLLACLLCLCLPVADAAKAKPASKRKVNAETGVLYANRADAMRLADEIAERRDLDLVLHLGDYLYEYGDGQYGSFRPTQPTSEIVTLTDYRTRHAQYKTDADLQALHRQHAMVPIWDDHETANDAWQRGAQNHDSATEGLWAARRRAALQAYYEWMPVREPADLKQAQRSFRLGDIKIGDITIDVPDGRTSFDAEIDFTATRGFILRVSAVLDLFQQPASASWLIQAIDPLTGEVLQDATRGLLAPNDASGTGAGFVSYTVVPGDDVATGTTV